MAKVYNCSECDYCYINICGNDQSDMFGQLIDWLGLAEEDMDCVIINGKDHDELTEEEMENDDEG